MARYHLIVVLAALLAASWLVTPGNAGATSSATTPVFTLISVTAPSRVVPLGAKGFDGVTAGPFTVTVRGTVANVNPTSVTLNFQGDTSFWDATAAKLTYSKEISRTTTKGVTTYTVEWKSSTVGTAQIGSHTISWLPTASTGSFGALVSADVEITCSDGINCNGVERLVGGVCQRPAKSLCDDGVSCTTDVCDEASGSCQWIPQSSGCKSCASKNCNPSCKKKTCGDDGCGGSCGTCNSAIGEVCNAGVCQVSTQPGTCASPLDLVGLLTAGDGSGAVPNINALSGSFTLNGDNSDGINAIQPICNTQSTATEKVYIITIPATSTSVGVDIRMSGLDSVLQLQSDSCLNPSTSSILTRCSDDAVPPGDLGSRVTAMLQPGHTYWVVCDGYSASQTGPFKLDVLFVPSCVPNCDARFCGPDPNCGANCGLCSSGLVCNSGGRCSASTCVPNCKGRNCGDDGCGGSCGTCQAGELCPRDTGKCKSFPECDGRTPICKGGAGCGKSGYCGTDCTCYKLGEATPDLVINADITASIIYETRSFSSSSCALFEGCIDQANSVRKLLRFPVEVINQGRADLTPPSAGLRPDMFEWSSCHGHYHFKGFAEYELLDGTGAIVLRGRKQAYCMEDSHQKLLGPNIKCSATSDCSAQGIQVGWSDVYGNDLDCQWLDVTDVPAGTYRLRIRANVLRKFHEENLENNAVIVLVTIPSTFPTGASNSGDDGNDGNGGSSALAAFSSSGGIAGIVIGAAALMALVAFVVVRRTRNRRQGAAPVPSVSMDNLQHAPQTETDLQRVADLYSHIQHPTNPSA